jgi:hypothetical protein
MEGPKKKKINTHLCDLAPPPLFRPILPEPSLLGEDSSSFSPGAESREETRTVPTPRREYRASRAAANPPRKERRRPPGAAAAAASEDERSPVDRQQSPVVVAAILCERREPLQRVVRTRAVETDRRNAFVEAMVVANLRQGEEEEEETLAEETANYES